MLHSLSETLHSAAKNLKRSFISSEDEQYLWQIKKLLDQLLFNQAMSPQEMLALRLIERFHLQELDHLRGEVRKASHEADVEQDWIKYLNVAAAAYGWKLKAYLNAQQTGISKEVSDKDANYQFLEEICFLKRTQIVHDQWNTKGRCPAHFVAFCDDDTSTREVIIAIRGTLSVSDAITDAVARSVQFCGGLAHEGFAEAAKSLFETIQPALSQLKESHEISRVTVCGHSLGAGTATLLAILLKSMPEYRSKVRAFAYAAPPSFSSNFTPRDVFCFIHNDDIVCRLSEYSLESLSLLVRLVSTKVSISKHLLGGVIDKETADIITQCASEAKPQNATELHLVGKVYWLVNEVQVNVYGETEPPVEGASTRMSAFEVARLREKLLNESYELRQIENVSLFSTILVSKDAVVKHHVPERYMNAFHHVSQKSKVKM